MVLLLCSGATHAQARSGHTAAAPAISGSVINGAYHNPFFGFAYKLPLGWVDRTQEMREDSPEGPAKAQVLLAIFERPPEANAETPNAVVVIAAESVSSYPGLKSAADYFGPLTEVTGGKGFKVVNQPYEFPLGGRQLVRGDFGKQLKTLTAYQSTLVMLAKRYIVSFTFVGTSEDEVQERIEGLSFPTKPPVR